MSGKSKSKLETQPGNGHLESDWLDDEEFHPVIANRDDMMELIDTGKEGLKNGNVFNNRNGESKFTGNLSFPISCTINSLP